MVSRDTIRANDYNLNIPRYVDSSENGESWDIYASMFGGIPEKEIDELTEYWQAFPKLRADLFSKTSTAYAELKVVEVKSAITQHPNVKAFATDFTAAFNDFHHFLKTELLTNMELVPVSKEETILSEDIFGRLKKLPLLDKYAAYQLLDDEWTKIEIDLEIIQTEGFEATKKVDPNMVMKKKNGKDQEVQEGWIGRVMPFELVEETYLKDQLQQLKQKEGRLLEITAHYEEILDSLSEDEKELETVNDAKDEFVNAAVTKEAKQLNAERKKKGDFPEDSYEAKIIQVDELLSEEKELKAKVKAETAKLHLLTKETIEKLTDEQVYELLERKWMNPLVTSLNKLPEVLINELTAKVQALAEKYATTYSHLTKEIHQTETVLSSLIDDLVGNEFDLKGLSEFKLLLKGE